MVVEVLSNECENPGFDLDSSTKLDLKAPTKCVFHFARFLRNNTKTKQSDLLWEVQDQVKVVFSDPPPDPKTHSELTESQ